MASPETTGAITTRDESRINPSQPLAFPGNLSGTQFAAQVDLSPALGAKNPTAVAIQDCSGRDKAQNGCGWSADGTAYTVDTHATQGVAYSFSCKDHGADAIADLAPTMRAMGHGASHANAGGQLAVCVTGDVTHALRADGFDASEDGTGRGTPMVVQAMAVRRLTPIECERLQGFPDGHTAIPWRGKPADDCPDGPRYKALGNSMAVNVMQWIGRRAQEYLHGGQSDFKTGQSCQRLLTARAAQNGAPGRSRTCDPRLRRPS